MHHSVSTSVFGAVLCLFEPVLDPQQMDLGLDAELAQPIRGLQVLQHATIYFLLFYGSIVLAELQRHEKGLHV